MLNRIREWRYQRALTKLMSLDDADAVAKFLKRRFVRGIIGEATACPVANYLRRVGGRDVSVSDFGVGNGERYQKWNEPVSNFINRFDEELYPQLVNEAVTA